MVGTFFLNNYAFFIFALLYGLFNLLLYDKFFPITEGWFQDYARYMMQGYIPYKDFYVPVPPGFIYLIKVLRVFFEDTFIYFRIYGIIERLFLTALVFFIFKRIFCAKIVFIALLTGSIVYISNMQDLFYGYYQSSFLFSVLVLYTAIKMYERYDFKDVYFWSGLYGFFSSCSFLFKQTIGGLLPCILGIVFVLLTVRKDRIKTLKCCCAALIAVLSIMLIVATFLQIEGALGSCIQQVFAGAQSKGSLQSIFLGFIPRMISKESVTITLLSFLVFFCYDICKEKSDRVLTFSCGILFFSFEVLMIFRSFIRYFYFSNNDKSISLLCCVLFLLLIFCSYIFVIDNHEIRSVLVLGLNLLIFFIVISLFQIKPFAYLSFGASNARQAIIHCMFFINLIWCFAELVSLIYSDFNYRQAIQLFVLAASFAVMYAHGLSHIVEEHGTLLITTLLVCNILSSDFSSFRFYNVLKSFTVIYCVLTIVFILVQRLNYPYYWWGVNTLPSSYNSKYTYLDVKLHGLLGDKASVNEMNKIYKTIEKYKGKNDTMYTFPHINYFNVMSGLNSPTFSKVHYFDVCPDYIIEHDLQLLRDNPPKFVLIQNFEENVWKFHENAFRDGKQSSQRKIIEHFHSQVRDNKYKLIDIFTIGKADPIVMLMKEN